MTDRILTLAIGSGRPHAEVYEYWSERAGVRQYDGGQSREEAEQGAMGDVEQWLRETKGQG